MNTHRFLFTAGVYPNIKMVRASLFGLKFEKSIDNSKIDSALEQVSNLSLQEIIVDSKFQHQVTPRQVGMFFYALNGNSATKTAERFNCKHPNAISAVNKTCERYELKGYEQITGMIKKVSEITGITVSKDFWNED